MRADLERDFAALAEVDTQGQPEVAAARSVLVRISPEKEDVGGRGMPASPALAVLPEKSDGVGATQHRPTRDHTPVVSREDFACE